MAQLILRVDASGQPLAWMPWQEAVVMYVKDQILWATGGTRMRVHGGTNRLSGRTSVVDIDAIVAMRGRVRHDTLHASVPPLTNRELFARDRHTCLYCLKALDDRELTRDHIVPLSRDGHNTGTTWRRRAGRATSARAHAHRTKRTCGCMRCHLFPTMRSG